MRAAETQTLKAHELREGGVQGSLSWRVSIENCNTVLRLRSAKPLVLLLSRVTTFHLHIRLCVTMDSAWPGSSEMGCPFHAVIGTRGWVQSRPWQCSLQDATWINCATN